MTQLAKEAAKIWSSTLRLPKSSFPARPAPADLATYVRRCTDDLYAWQAKARPATNSFILHDGPPYANGDLHAGHALNKILKDIICRTKLADGKRVNFVPGWDCHGLPIELKALELHGWKTRQTHNAVAVRQAARSFAADTIRKQMQEFRTWGIMAGWSDHWKTMDTAFELRQLAVFRAMAKNSLIYRKHKPVYWSPSSQTALAEAELEYKEDHISTAALVKFSMHLPRDGSDSEPTFACIWTTTPWTLPANQAIAFNENLEYVRVRSEEHGLLIFAKVRLPYMQDLLKETFQNVDDHISADELQSTTYNGPAVLDQSRTGRPIFHAGFVSADAGTGLVHCAPGHGMEDYEALQPRIRAHQVNVKAPVDDQGCFTDEAAPCNPALLAGKNVFKEGNDTVLEAFQEDGLLLKKHQYKHKYPYDWRTRQPVLIRATAQWFADISNIKQNALDALQVVHFQPLNGLARLKSFVENRNEWCISRQRAWGVPIPAIYHNVTGEATLSDESIEHIVKVIGERGIDAWWSDPPHEPAWIVPGLDAADYRRGTDTMDVWFDSGTSWTDMIDIDATQEGPLADIYIEGTDQHRGWFQSSLLTNVAYQKSVNSTVVISAPFKNLLTHGFTLDAEGRKMSKSIGNVVSPDEIISGVLAASQAAVIQTSKSNKKHKQLPLGPDALRLWVASSDWTKDITISETIIRTVHAALHKYRVTIKLLLGALKDFDPAGLVDYEDMQLVDRIALSQLSKVSTLARSAFQEFEFSKAVTAINRWVNAEFSGFYMEAVKDSLYCDSANDVRRESVQTVLYHTLCQMQSMLGPLTPILIEESWEHCPPMLKDQMEHPLQRVWEPLPQEWNDEELAQNVMPVVMAINAATKTAQERARSDKKMGSSLESDVIFLLELDAFTPATYMSCEPFFRANHRTDLEGILVVSRYDLMPTTAFVENGTMRDALRDMRGGMGRKECLDQYRKKRIDPVEREVLTSLPEVSEAYECDADMLLGMVWDTVQDRWTYDEDVVLPHGQKIGVVVVHAPTGRKCDRCWRYAVRATEKSPDLSLGEIETGERHQVELCGRCWGVLRGSGRKE